MIIPDNDTESDSLICLALSPISKLEAFIFAVAVELVTVEAEDPHRSGSVVDRLLALSIHKKYLILELQWRQAPPCSCWDTGRVAPLLFSPGGIC